MSEYKLTYTTMVPAFPKLKNKIYEPFFTTKPTTGQGTGLGLSINYDIITKAMAANQK